jgi:hypothetical protein
MGPDPSKKFDLRQRLYEYEQKYSYLDSIGNKIAHDFNLTMERVR